MKLLVGAVMMAPMAGCSTVSSLEEEGAELSASKKKSPQCYGKWSDTARSCLQSTLSKPPLGGFFTSGET